MLAKKDWTRILSLVLFSSVNALPSMAKALDQKAEMFRTLDNISAIFKTYYAMEELKQEELGIDIPQSIAKLKSQLKQRKLDPITFRQKVKNVLDLAQDLHVELGIESSHGVSLPFSIRSATTNGKTTFYLAWIEKSLLNPTNFPFNVGDEVISWNGKPVQAELQKLSPSWPENNAGLQRRLQQYLTDRQGFLGFTLPEESVRLKILAQGKTLAKEVEIPWEVKKEEILFPPRLFQGSVGPGHLAKNPWMPGHREGFLPQLGPIIVRSPESATFHSYIFSHHGKRFGYLRLNSFQIADSMKAFLELAQLIQMMEEQTTALVIDILNNPGGDYPFMNAVASLLTAKDMEPIRFRKKISFEEVRQAVRTLDFSKGVEDLSSAQLAYGRSFGGHPMTLKYAKSLIKEAKHLLDEWNAGKTFTTRSFTQGIETISPIDAPSMGFASSIKVYGKPILILTDSGSISSADFFASIMKENNRATLLGNRTGGAGGLVRQVKFPNSFGIHHVSLPDAIAFTKKGQHIEGKGVEPHIRYEYSPLDYQKNFKEFSETILSQLLVVSQLGGQQ